MFSLALQPEALVIYSKYERTSAIFEILEIFSLIVFTGKVWHETLSINGNYQTLTLSVLTSPVNFAVNHSKLMKHEGLAGV